MLRSLFRRGEHASFCRAYGALCYDYTFTRVLGTPQTSEAILQDLIGAWHTARTGMPSEALLDVCIIKPKVRDGAFPRSKGELVVDVRARDSERNYIIEVQHRVEPLFPHRALLYAAADIVSQHADDVTKSFLRPVHSLAFCDYDFVTSSKSGIATQLNAWRAKGLAHTPEPTKAIHAFTLQPALSSLAGIKLQGNVALQNEMAGRLSFLFALLPHAPRLEDLTVDTPPLLRWASLVAHVGPQNVAQVPEAVRTKGVALLLEILHDTRDETEMERIKEEEEAGQMQRALESALAEGEAKGLAKGMAEGKAEGMAEGKAKGMAEGTLSTLRLLGIQSAADYRSKFKSEPPPEVLAALSGI